MGKRFTGKKVIIGILILAISCMGIYPPWVAKIKRGNMTRSRDLGYALLITPPIDDGFGEMGQIDFSRLLLQCAVAIILAGGLIFLITPSKKTPS
jgi:hypothetical protein